MSSERVLRGSLEGPPSAKEFSERERFPGSRAPALSWLAVSEPAAQLESGDVGQHGIEEHEVGLDLLREIERLHAAVGGEDLEAVVRELLFEVRPHRALVFHQKNRPPDHGLEVSNASERRPDVLSRKKESGFEGPRFPLNHAVRICR